MFRLLELWLLIGTCLTTAAAGRALLEGRQSNSCPSNNYTAENGLTFTTTNLCLHNIPGGDITQEVTPDLRSCMDLCSASPAGRACFGVSYNIATGRCWMKNSTVLTAPISDSTGTHSALSTNFQRPDDVTCPYSNLTEITTQNGMRLQVLCNMNMPLNDYCSRDAPRPQRRNGVCPFHTDTIEECAEICSRNAPLCRGISWNPDMTSGYGNCYPKSDVSTSDFRAAPLRAPTSHLAIVQNINSLDPDCTDGSSLTASNGNRFDVSCNDNSAGNDLIQVHAETMEECASACGTFNNATAGECVSAVYDSTLRSGWENCWLKSQVESGSQLAGNHYLTKSTSSPEPGNGGNGGDAGGANPPSTGGDGGSTSSAWIAGAVIGPLAGVALIAFGVWFLRRRRRAAQPAPYAQEMAADPALPGYVAEKTASNTEVPELGGGAKPPGAGLGELPSDSQIVHELPANSK